MIVKSTDDLSGKIKNVIITNVSQGTLYGEVVSNLSQKTMPLKQISEISKLEQSLMIKKIDSETVNISINNNEVLMAIVGQFDQNLKYLSKLTDTEVLRGNSLTCKEIKKNYLYFVML